MILFRYQIQVFTTYTLVSKFVQNSYIEFKFEISDILSKLLINKLRSNHLNKSRLDLEQDSHDSNSTKTFNISQDLIKNTET